jgi:hypothetical protein
VEANRTGPVKLETPPELPHYAHTVVLKLAQKHMIHGQTAISPLGQGNSQYYKKNRVYWAATNDHRQIEAEIGGGIDSESPDPYFLMVFPG